MRTTQVYILFIGSSRALTDSGDSSQFSNTNIHVEVYQRSIHTKQNRLTVGKSPDLYRLYDLVNENQTCATTVLNVSMQSSFVNHSSSAKTYNKSMDLFFSTLFSF